jgi:K(+)-stimulated pyrophosphate-energized sodium pump
MTELATLAALGVLGVAGTGILWRWVLSHAAPGGALARAADAVAAGGAVLLARQTRGAAAASGAFGAGVFALYAILRVKQDGLWTSLGASVAAFVLGAAASLASGWTASFVAVRASSRLAAMLVAERSPRVRPDARATHPLNTALQVALRGGAVMAVAAAGVSLLATTLAFAAALVAGGGAVLPLAVAGFGFGASLVSLFVQAGGGVFAAAAEDAGAETASEDLGLRDPARVARAVGAHARTWTALAAELLETEAAALAAALFLADATRPSGGGALALGFFLFPLAARAFGLLAAVVGVMSVGTDGLEDAVHALGRGHVVTAVLAALGLGGAAFWLLGTYWTAFFACAAVGVLAEIAIVRLARASGPSRVAEVQGLAGALSAAWRPAGVLAAAMVASYELGEHSGLSHAGPYGAALAATGMLATSGYVLSLNGLASIAGGAGRLMDLAQLLPGDNADRDRVEALARSGRAVARAFAVGAGTLAAFALLMAYAARVPRDVPVVASPAVLVGAVAGALLAGTFSALSSKTVAAAARRFADEARRRIAALPKAMTDFRPATYGKAVDGLAKDAVRRMARDGAAIVGMPIALGFLFREALGTGAEAVGALLLGAVVAGVVLALVSENLEAARRMAPALAPPVKLLGAISLILAPLFL